MFTAVSQPDPTEEIKFLKAFDLNYAYGPAVGKPSNSAFWGGGGLGKYTYAVLLPVHCDYYAVVECMLHLQLFFYCVSVSGLSRSERWERAHGLGLNPDPRVKKLIQQHSDNPKYTEW